MAGAKDLYSNWTNLPFEERRQIVETITDSIVIGSDDIEINLHYVPDRAELSAKAESSGNKATHQHRCVAFLPNWPKSLKSLKPVPYERKPVTLGQHLKKRRLEENLLQKDVAEMIGCGTWTYITWETDRSKPAIKWWPLIIKFLEYDPNSAPVCMATGLVAARRRLGLSMSNMSARLSVNPTSYLRWESGRGKPTEDRQRRVKRLLEELGYVQPEKSE